MNIILRKIEEFEEVSDNGMQIIDLFQYISENWILRNCNSKNTLDLALQLSLVSLNHTRQIKLTENGRLFIQVSDQSKLTQLSEMQKELIRKLVFKNNIQNTLENVVTRRKENFLIIKKAVKAFKITITTLFKDINLLDDMDDDIYLILSEKYNNIWTKLIKSDNYTEEDLEAIIEQQRKLGKIGEEIAFKFEKQRVTNYGNKDLIKEVKLVATDHVDFGYDIKSVEPNGDPKYIEVKTTSNQTPRFFISRNEFRVSKLHKENYWIYIVILKKRKILMFNDIPEKVNSGFLSLEPSNFEVIFDLEKYKPIIEDFI